MFGHPLPLPHRHAQNDQAVLPYPFMSYLRVTYELKATVVCLETSAPLSEVRLVMIFVMPSVLAQSLSLGSYTKFGTQVSSKTVKLKRQSNRSKWSISKP